MLNHRKRMQEIRLQTNYGVSARRFQYNHLMGPKKVSLVRKMIITVLKWLSVTQFVQNAKRELYRNKNVPQIQFQNHDDAIVKQIKKILKTWQHSSANKKDFDVASE